MLVNTIALRERQFSFKASLDSPLANLLARSKSWQGQATMYSSVYRVQVAKIGQETELEIRKKKLLTAVFQQTRRDVKSRLLFESARIKNSLAEG